ncbi:hypothetical protein PFICI_02080 [Pestalotiopsis fici W106-1]|uniref:CFEM domain-containing protein n=1 Tax=Pestalotiopsis fici (strain W106-1 / CGMCC3.15140) TaxID=1229662 RepID=W3XRW8_PESFW|nr:uncharacterized protein PFICI_02080 [Pestalotiopsis fici W106-1]ETS88252.1 hypothetical protein PFICI_02080 [Pestalotiopsis fici W106-1]
MWFSRSILLPASVMLSQLVASQAVSSGSSNVTAMIQLLESSVPECAFNCFVSVVPQSTCDLTDTACICSNQDLATSLAVCMAQAGCTVIEQLQTQRFEKEMCGAEVRSQRTYILATTWTLYAIALLFVVMRLVARAPYLSKKSWDDWTIIACLLALTPAHVIAYLMVESGLGRDIWMLSASQITNTLLYFFVEEYLYTFLVVFTKISILCLYIRVFAVYRFRLLCYILIGFTLAFGISCWVSTGFNCVPITFMWQGWDGQHSGTCMDTSKQAFALAGVNMGLDILVFLLPIPQLWALQMSLKRKLGVILMFTVGLFVTICSIIRLQTIMEFGNSADPTYDYSALAVWSLVEIDVGVICASLPGVAALLRRVFPRLFTTRGSSDPSAQKESTGNSGGSDFRKQGFARMHERRNNISKTVSITVDSKSDEFELVDRYSRGTSSPDLESAYSVQPLRTGYKA